MKRNIVHYRRVPAGPPPFPEKAWTRCGRTVPYDRATDDSTKVNCRGCRPGGRVLQPLEEFLLSVRGINAQWEQKFEEEFFTRLGIDPTAADWRLAKSYWNRGISPEIAADAAIDRNHAEGDR